MADGLINLRFPEKLWAIVNDCRSGSIYWSSTGNSILLNYQQFQDEFMSSGNGYFKTTKISSFIRQLNLYGFIKLREKRHSVSKGDVHEFEHPSFIKERPDLLSKVRRKVGNESFEYESSAVRGRLHKQKKKSTENSFGFCSPPRKRRRGRRRKYLPAAVRNLPPKVETDVSTEDSRDLITILDDSGDEEFDVFFRKFEEPSNVKQEIEDSGYISGQPNGSSFSLTKSDWSTATDLSSSVDNAKPDGNDGVHRDNTITGPTSLQELPASFRTSTPIKISESVVKIDSFTKQPELRMPPSETTNTVVSMNQTSVNKTSVQEMYRPVIANAKQTDVGRLLFSQVNFQSKENIFPSVGPNHQIPPGKPALRKPPRAPLRFPLYRRQISRAFRGPVPGRNQTYVHNGILTGSPRPVIRKPPSNVYPYLSASPLTLAVTQTGAVGPTTSENFQPRVANQTSYSTSPNVLQHRVQYTSTSNSSKIQAITKTTTFTGQPNHNTVFSNTANGVRPLLTSNAQFIPIFSQNDIPGRIYVGQQCSSDGGSQTPPVSSAAISLPPSTTATAFYRPLLQNFENHSTIRGTLPRSTHETTTSTMLNLQANNLARNIRAERTFLGLLQGDGHLYQRQNDAPSAAVRTLPGYTRRSSEGDVKPSPITAQNDPEHRVAELAFRMRMQNNALQSKLKSQLGSTVISQKRSSHNLRSTEGQVRPAGSGNMSFQVSEVNRKPASSDPHEQEIVETIKRDVEFANTKAGAASVQSGDIATEQQRNRNVHGTIFTSTDVTESRKSTAQAKNEKAESNKEANYDWEFIKIIEELVEGAGNLNELLMNFEMTVLNAPKSPRAKNSDAIGKQRKTPTPGYVCKRPCCQPAPVEESATPNVSKTTEPVKIPDSTPLEKVSEEFQQKPTAFKSEASVCEGVVKNHEAKVQNEDTYGLLDVEFRKRSSIKRPSSDGGSGNVGASGSRRDPTTANAPVAGEETSSNANACRAGDESLLDHAFYCRDIPVMLQMAGLCKKLRNGKMIMRSVQHLRPSTGVRKSRERPCAVQLGTTSPNCSHGDVEVCEDSRERLEGSWRDETEKRVKPTTARSTKSNEKKKSSKKHKMNSVANAVLTDPLQADSTTETVTNTKTLKPDPYQDEPNAS